MTPAAPLQLALFTAADVVVDEPTARECAEHAPVKPVLPRLLPQHLQQAFIVPGLSDFRAKLRQMNLCDALVCGRERVEYVQTMSDKTPQIRLYRSGRVVAVARVKNGNPETVKRDLVSVLYARGWQPDRCKVEVGVAYDRRKLRRTLAAWC